MGTKRGAALSYLDVAVESETDDCLSWPYATRMGYGAVELDGRLVGAHRVVLERFTGEPPNGRFCLHSCANKVCVNPRHLRWGTPQDNMNDREAHGNTPRGERFGRSALTEDDVIAIRSKHVPRAVAGSSGSTAALAEEYGVSKSNIVQIVRRTIWRHI